MKVNLSLKFQYKYLFYKNDIKSLKNKNSLGIFFKFKSAVIKIWEFEILDKVLFLSAAKNFSLFSKQPVVINLSFFFEDNYRL